MKNKRSRIDITFFIWIFILVSLSAYFGITGTFFIEDHHTSSIYHSYAIVTGILLIVSGYLYVLYDKVAK